MKLWEKVRTAWRGLAKPRPAYYGVAYLALIPLFGLVFAYVPKVELDCGSPPCGGWWDSVYFSAVTITTLGYGDVLPANVLTRVLAGLEAVGGITLIGLFLNALSHVRGDEVSDAERKREEEAALSRDKAALRRYNKLVELYARNYLTYVGLLVTPVDGEGHRALERAVNREFAFQDLKDLYQPTFLLTDNLRKTRVEYYFQAQDQLTEALLDLMRSVNLDRWPQLAKLCLEFLESCETLNFRDGLIGNKDSKSGSKPMVDVARSMIETHTGPVEFAKSNLKNQFVALHKQVHLGLGFMDQYEQQVAQALAETT